MLKFSKINILVTLVLSILVIFFSISNITKFDDNFFKKKINLGLDLQGGSYLLLKIDNEPVIIKELQNKAVSLKNFFKENNIQIFNININENKEIIFSTNEKNVEKVESFLNDKDGSINIYFDQFKSFQYEVENEKEKQSDIYVELSNRLQKVGADFVVLPSIGGSFCLAEFLPKSPLPVVDVMTPLKSHLDEYSETLTIKLPGSYSDYYQDVYNRK